ncbi:MAG TPA: tRNA uridine-5-carboxymethylaminomethyl(34) synthesis GTPase MnmE [Bacteroidales bacterium]|nr:tRNA uridine-5-carboxymethylaminomethyl(34) synthesis GTPase MnmE [Bacteroidales bacterium]
MTINHDYIIVAPATGGGGAIAIIRVSGPGSLELCDKIFKARGSSKKVSEQDGYTSIYGDIAGNDQIIDDVIINVYRAPHSYTGEDSAEISCHASPYIQHKILQLLISNGASPARPGEFTQRAFLNGRMDLSQAEAVADLIASESEAAHRLAMHQMRGGFSGDIKKLRKELLHFASLVELELDFSEEDVEFADRARLKELVKKVKAITDSLAESFQLGNAIRNGIPVAIVGKPNAGKSTLLNAILKDDKAIVSDIPGTTRDAIEDTATIDGILYRFIDTAGLRETSDRIETLGIRKTYQKIRQANIVLLLTEATDSPETIHNSVKAINDQIKGTGKKLILVINKTDLAGKIHLENIMETLCPENEANCIFMSALSDEDVAQLKLLLGKIIEKERLTETNSIVTNMRHYYALNKTSESLNRVLEGLKTMVPEDLIAMDIRQAIHWLGEITGEITTDEILANIFKNFCIGK